MENHHDPITVCRDLLSALRYDGPQNSYQLSNSIQTGDPLFVPYVSELLAREWIAVIPETLDTPRTRTLADQVRQTVTDVTLEQIRLEPQPGLIEGTRRWHDFLQTHKADWPYLFLALTDEGLLALKKLQAPYK